MGCQNEERKREFISRFEQLGELGDDGPAPFHFGTHYSSAITVTGYLMRLTPYTEAYLDLQGGSYDHADRMFWSIKRAWDSASACVPSPLRHERSRDKLTLYICLQAKSERRARVRLAFHLSAAPNAGSSLPSTLAHRLTPEFFYLPDFLTNSNRLDFGRRQESDEPIDNVALPPWADDDPRRFIELHREVRPPHSSSIQTESSSLTHLGA